MGKITEGFRPLNKSEGFAHIENYYRSRLGSTEYCKRHKLTRSQFYGWRKRYLAIHPEVKSSMKSKKKFHPVKIKSPAGVQLSGFEIHYPHGVRLVLGFGQSLPIEQIVELIKLRV